jgi:hypothetical protein
VRLSITYPQFDGENSEELFFGDVRPTLKEAHAVGLTLGQALIDDPSLSREFRGISHLTLEERVKRAARHHAARSTLSSHNLPKQLCDRPE